MAEHGLDLERPYREQDPLDMDDAREASRRVARLRRDFEKIHRQAIQEKATAEADYRRLRSEAIVKARVDNAATIAKEIADGHPKVRQALIDWKIAEGLVDAAKERLRGIEGERSMLKSLIDWSSSIANVLRQTSGVSGS